MVLLADTVLAVHFLFVLFIVGGLVLIWAGVALKWRWVRNPWFRVAHLAAIVFVAAETLLGLPCPLTVWEDELRGRTAHVDFVARLIHRIMFYSFPEWVFIAVYVIFALAVLITCVLAPPAWPRTGK
jgi:hypothetical protein